MHIVRFQGGFANQLFQYCLYLRLIEKYGEKNVFADIIHYQSNNDHGGFKLDKYVDLRYLNGIPKRAVWVTEETIDTIRYSRFRKYYYCGYWQDESFFPSDISPVVKIIEKVKLSEKNKVLLEKICATHSVSVHIRRGDYVNNYLHGNIANMAYIHNSIEYIKNLIDDPSFFIFSDDIEWCKANLEISGENIIFSDGSSDGVEADILLMSRCRHNIIANSSFSWWAQKLNGNTDKVVISPEYWYNNEKMANRLIKSNFVKIRNVPNITTRSDKPFFSVFIGVFDNDQFIRRCLSSVLNQTYADIEVIAVGQSDVVQEYITNDARITPLYDISFEELVNHKDNWRLYAKGEYCLFVAGTDYLDCRACEILYEAVEQYKGCNVEFSSVHEPGARREENVSEFNKCYSHQDGQSVRIADILYYYVDNGGSGEIV